LVDIIPISQYLKSTKDISCIKGINRKFYSYFFDNGGLAGISDVEIDPYKNHSKKYRKDKETGQLVEDTSEVTTRGKVIGLSARARKRMIDLCASIDKSIVDEKEVLFLTLTYGKQVGEKDYKQSKKHLNIFNMNLKNLFKSGDLKKVDGSVATLNDSFWIWRIEIMPESRRLHYHFAIVGARYICKDWINRKWSSIVGVKSRTDIRNARSWNNTTKYFSKTLAYLSKTSSPIDSNSEIGRNYGLVNKAGYINSINLIIREIKRQDYIRLKRTIINLIIRMNQQRGRWTKSYCRKMKKILCSKRNFSRYIDSNVFQKLTDLVCGKQIIKDVSNLVEM